MKKAFLLVGHENFGKSRTLVELTKSRNSQHTLIENKYFALKRKSNDDIGKELLNYVKGILANKDCEYLLLCFCPNFIDSKKCSEKILETLKKECQLYSFVLVKQFGTDKKVTQEEIENLKKYSNVFEYNESEDARDRADALVKYIKKNIQI
jgi:hypothetical protein